MAYIKERKIPKTLDGAFKSIEKRFGHRMMPARLLLWYPKAFIGSMVLEGLVTHYDQEVPKRLLKLIRMQVSLAVTCPFCIDMNASGFKRYHITKEEIMAMQGRIKVKEVASFTYKEKLVLYYIKALTKTPIQMNPIIVERMKAVFSERALTIIITTIAQVDYWTRVIQGFGIQPAGFLEACDLKYFE